MGDLAAEWEIYAAVPWWVSWKTCGNWELMGGPMPQLDGSFTGPQCLGGSFMGDLCAVPGS